MFFFLSIFLLCSYAQNLIQVASDNGLTSLVTAVNTNNLAGTLNGTGPFTVFAPTNTAFNGVNINTASQTVSDILLYHVISSNVASGSIVNNQVSPSVLGKNLFFSLDASSNVYVNGIRVVTPDVLASNGRAHVIGTVLTPPSSTLLQLVQNTPEVNTLESLVVASNPTSNLITTLNGSTTYTVFAPTETAIAALPACVVALLSTNLGLLTDILNYHVVTGTIFSDVIASGSSSVTPVFSANGNIAVTKNSSGVFVNNARVTTANVLATNGVVHLIDQVLLPPTLTVTCSPSFVGTPAPTNFSATYVAPLLLIVLSALFSFFL